MATAIIAECHDGTAERFPARFIFSSGGGCPLPPGGRVPPPEVVKALTVKVFEMVKALTVKVFEMVKALTVKVFEMVKALTVKVFEMVKALTVKVFTSVGGGTAPVAGGVRAGGEAGRRRGADR